MSTLYAIVCAAGPAKHVGILVSAAQQRGHDVVVVSTPSARNWLNGSELEHQTGYPIRHLHVKERPGIVPSPDAIIVAPATFNTINKLALGIADNLALDILNESLGMGRPIVLLPYVNSAYAKHPAFIDNVDRLHHAGVTVLLDVHEPRSGDVGAFPWLSALDALPPGS